MSKVPSRFRNVMFTSFKEVPPPWDEAKMVYMVFQREKCPKTGKFHFQGYVELSKQMRLKAVKRLLGDTVHIEPRYGTQEEAIKYCTKEESRVAEPVIYGEPRRQGSRRDISAAKAKLIAGEPLNKIIWECNSYQAMRCVEKLHSFMPISHEYKKKEVYWLWGKTGAGKTRMAKEACPAEETWNSAIKGDWFDGYYGQKYAIIDEHRAKNWSYDLMLRLLDGFEMRVPIKGGFTVWKPEVVYITSPLPPDKAYAGQLQFQGSIDQLLRRITEVKMLGEPDPYPIFREIPKEFEHTTINLY